MSLILTPPVFPKPEVVTQAWYNGVLAPNDTIAGLVLSILEDPKDDLRRKVLADAIQDLALPTTDEIADRLRNDNVLGGRAPSWIIRSGPYHKGWVPRLVWQRTDHDATIVAGLKRSRMPKCRLCREPLILTRGDRYELTTELLTRQGGWENRFARCAGASECHRRWRRLNEEKERRRANRARLVAELAGREWTTIADDYVNDFSEDLS
jgi:hypothetical protein